MAVINTTVIVTNCIVIAMYCIDKFGVLGAKYRKMLYNIIQ